MKFVFKIFAALAIIFVLIVAALFIRFFYVIPHNALKPIEDLSCSGTIVSLRDSGTLCYIGVQQGKDITWLQTDRMCDYSNVFYLSIAPGDSLIKEKGKLSLTIIRKGYTARHHYDYPMCIY